MLIHLHSNFLLDIQLCNRYCLFPTWKPGIGVELEQFLQTKQCRCSRTGNRWGYKMGMLWKVTFYLAAVGSGWPWLNSRFLWRQCEIQDTGRCVRSVWGAVGVGSVMEVGGSHAGRGHGYRRWDCAVTISQSTNWPCMTGLGQQLMAPNYSFSFLQKAASVAWPSEMSLPPEAG